MSENDSNFLISIIVPAFNEEQVIEKCYDHLAKVLTPYRHEILFIDDGSHDKTWHAIEKLSKEHPEVHGISFSRNFGHQAALTAGLEHAKGDAAIIMDADMQDPPEMIPPMIQKWREGYDVVYGVRTARQADSMFKKTTAEMFYKIMQQISKIDLPINAGDFRLLSRKLIDCINQMPERIRFMRGLTSWAGFRQIGLPYERGARYAGKTKYPFLKMLVFALDGISSFSSLPLHLASFLGLIMTSISFIIMLYAFYVKFFTNTAVRGWTSLLLVIVFLGGIQLLMIGIIGQYVGRIYEEVKRRPIYLVGRKTENLN